MKKSGQVGQVSGQCLNLNERGIMELNERNNRGKKQGTDNGSFENEVGELFSKFRLLELHC